MIDKFEGVFRIGLLCRRTVIVIDVYCHLDNMSYIMAMKMVADKAYCVLPLSVITNPRVS